MQNKEPEITEEIVSDSVKNDSALSQSIIIAALILAGACVYTARLKSPSAIRTGAGSAVAKSDSERGALTEAVILPARWGDLGARMVSVGVIDEKKFHEVYSSRGGLGDEEEKLLLGTDNGNLVVTKENSGILLNLLWALGLGAKNDILEKGPMVDMRYGGAGNFASTGGWTLAGGSAMDHYSRHPLIVLTQEQQKLIERVAKNIYRPCCNNSTYFPDCNHGMAMLGFLELMASQGVAEEEMYKAALQLNSFWFPDTYETIAGYLESIGSSWDAVSPREILGMKYSSGSGYRAILEKFNSGKQKNNSGGGCGVENDPAPASGSGGSGCGV